ncbi:MAG: UPF0158 family protein [Balneolales bacterium]
MKQEKKTLDLSNSLLEDIAMATNDNNYEMEWYLDVQDGKTVLISDFTDDDEMRELVENDLDEERFIPIPVKGPAEGWHEMEQFILSRDDQDEKTQNLLLTIIKGKGAFRRFKDALYDVGLHEQWFGFKDRQDRKDVLNWLKSRNLITDEDMDRGMMLYEETLAIRKQREEGIANMITGTLVKCISNNGHTHQLTINKTYEVFDEQKQHLNIKIKDDRDKRSWLPKSHFELLNRTK